MQRRCTTETRFTAGSGLIDGSRSTPLVIHRKTDFIGGPDSVGPVPHRARRASSSFSGVANPRPQPRAAGRRRHVRPFLSAAGRRTAHVAAARTVDRGGGANRPPAHVASTMRDVSKTDVERCCAASFRSQNNKNKKRNEKNNTCMAVVGYTNICQSVRQVTHSVIQ